MKVDFNPFAGAKMPDMKPAGGKKPRMGRTAAIVAAVAAVAVLGVQFGLQHQRAGKRGGDHPGQPPGGHDAGPAL